MEVAQVTSGAEQSVAKMVTVRSNGVKKEVLPVTGMTVGDAIKESGVKPGYFSKLFVNGQPARSNTALNPGDEVTITPRIRNGSF